ncbi:MAG: SDR family oxidoreductase [Gemmatimonadaceae bacterium]
MPSTPSVSRTDPRPPKRPLAIITGASEGLGRDFARLYAADGHDLVLVARRDELLSELAHELESTHDVKCQVVPADLSRPEERSWLLRRVEAERGRLVALVNNAGLGGLGRFDEMPQERIQLQLDVNVSALTHLTRVVLPWMRENGAGHVMNLASVAAFTPGPLMSVYYASKAYVLSLSEALHNECAGSGVTVTAVCPGPTITGFQRVAGVVRGSGGAPPMDSAEVAAIAYRGTKAGKRVVVTGGRNRVAAFGARHLPRALMLRVIRRLQEKRSHPER